MRIRFIGPFEKLAGKEMALELERPITLRELIGCLSRRAEGFTTYTELETDEALAAHVMFLRGGRHLRLDDRVRAEDEVDVVLPVTGG